ncbi:MAG TPA: NUDIX domain-containing protein [Candidatus Paceibacterota bacterium]|nr:NUDIX domain-containing protein [Candidatus Paceibacterota bacterium]
MAHIHEKIDFTTSVYIVCEGKVLLHKHKKLGIWLPPGGHIELDEDPTIAAVREAKEESGFDITLVGNPTLDVSLQDDSKDLTPPMFINRHHINDTHEHVDFIYFGLVVGGDLNPEDGVAMKWVSKEEIQSNNSEIREGVRLYALAALKYFESK